MNERFSESLRGYLIVALYEALAHADPRERLNFVDAEEAGEINELPFFATIEFSAANDLGSISGAASGEFLDATYPLEKHPDRWGAKMQADWLGEILNMTLGNIKRRLARHNHLINLTPPRFLHGSTVIDDNFREYGAEKFGAGGVEIVSGLFVTDTGPVFSLPASFRAI